MPQPAKIRNVAVFGHRWTGKTSLVEALLLPDRQNQPPWVGPGRDDHLGCGR